MEDYDDRFDDSCFSLDCEAQEYEESLLDKFIVENFYKEKDDYNERQKYLSEINDIISSI